MNLMTVIFIVDMVPLKNTRTLLLYYFHLHELVWGLLQLLENICPLGAKTAQAWAFKLKDKLNYPSRKPIKAPILSLNWKLHLFNELVLRFYLIFIKIRHKLNLYDINSNFALFNDHAKAPWTHVGFIAVALTFIDQFWKFFLHLSLHIIDPVWEEK